jgi:hypothetical protein
MVSSTNVYRIKPCCNTGFEDMPDDYIWFQLDNVATFVEGFYIANQTITFQYNTSTLSITGTINEGQCFIIAGPFPQTPGVTLDSNIWDFQEPLSPLAPLGCSEYDTINCECKWIYSISPCCREFGDQDAAAQQVNLALSDLNYEDGTYQYTGSGTFDVPNTNLTLEPGQCYTITRRLLVEPMQTTIELDFSTASWQQMNLELGCNDGRCQDCPEEGIAYLKYVPCCDSFDTIYVRTESYSGSQTIDPSGQISGSGPGNIGPIVNTAGYTGVFIWNGTSYNAQLDIGFVFGQCYTGTLHTLGSESAPAPQDNGDYNDLPLAPYSTQLSKIGECERPPCPECNPTVYALTNCDGITINTETDVSAYIDTYIE